MYVAENMKQRVVLSGLAAGMAVVVAVALVVGRDEPDKTPASGATATVTASPTQTAATVTATASPTPAAMPTAPSAAGVRAHVVEVASGRETELGAGIGSMAWAPDGQRLAVANNDQGLVVIDRGTGNAALWRPGPCRRVAWSPRGDQLAAWCGAVVIFDGAGKVVREAAWAGSELAWSPDGVALAAWETSAMVFEGEQATLVDGPLTLVRWLDDGRLATVGRASDGSVELRIRTRAAGWQAATALPVPAGAIGPSISGDGTVVAWAQPTGSAPAAPRWQVRTVAADGGRPLFAFAGSAPSYPNGPIRFAPRSRDVLLHTDVCGPKWGLAVGKADGTVAAVAEGVSPYVAEFSPDGKSVAYTSALSLWVVPTDGSAPPRKLAEGVHGPAGLEWSPDGSRIAFTPFFGGFGACEG